MGIDVQLRGEDDRILAEVGDENFVLAKATPNAFSGTRLLQYVVPWGDAVFNQSQSSDLATDIQDVRRNLEGSALADHLSNIEPLIERLSAETHSYLWFIGD